MTSRSIAKGKFLADKPRRKTWIKVIAGTITILTVLAYMIYFLFPALDAAR
jgi:uncharacterized membrane protein YbhN (UPF0104 family)